MTWSGAVRFVKGALSEDGEPSSARVLSAGLSVSGMALIWFMVRHAFYVDNPAKLETWVGGLPAIVYALAAFAVSPYGFNRVSAIFKKPDGSSQEVTVEGGGKKKKKPKKPPQGEAR